LSEQDSAAFLSSHPLFRGFPAQDLPWVLSLLKKRSVQEGQTLFECGQPGGSMFIVEQGSVSVEVMLDEQPPRYKVLSVFGPGDFFGEMSLIEQAPRSARAVCLMPCLFYELDRSALDAISARCSAGAVALLTEILRTISSRLRQSNTELALLCDLSRLALRPYPEEKLFLREMLAETMPHLGRGWSASAWLYNYYNEDLEQSAQSGEAFEVPVRVLYSPVNLPSAWEGEEVFCAVMPGVKRPDAFMFFRPPEPLPVAARNRMAVTFQTLAHFADSVIDNIRSRKEQAMRERLQARRQA